MPPQRRWTLMLVPDGCGNARTLSFTERAARRAIAVISGIGVVTLLGSGVLVGRLSVGVAHGGTVVGENASVLDARLDSLADTISALARRDEQIRLLAGLPTGNDIDEDESLRGTLTGSGGTAMGALAIDARPDVSRMIRRANLLAASFAEVTDTLQKNVEKLRSIPSIMPTAGWLSSAFSRSRFHPILHHARPHEGIDVAAPMGAPIVAPAAGTVTLVARQNGYGNVLEIDHGNGIVTKYAHCSRIVVKKGQRVQRGEVVANVGSTGLATGPHLHYEIHVHGKVVNPLTYVLPEGAIPD
ncbi:MAG TPA: M23 family metallopeptidase [Gemmatimonadaceae bacterium]|nr:M23 family metallopeptidase [Gemmatimonadaceae bacterium]